ncbi:MAG TPA: prolipoprotein diacylglyceryl transferase family protein [Candidatus Baltobacteraceae bacterium]|nr:prolipoprotein diacylglyceryl transferase family protein [Candidatus Baltobacteraceae bacterium]
MANEIFVLAMAACLAGVLGWGFRTLPRENWQIAAAIPIAKESSGHWRGLNLTYYGFFQASAYTVGLAMMIVLLGAVHIPLRSIVVIAVLILTCCIPASKLVARLVERKQATFTVGGAVFAAVLFVPTALWFVNRFLAFWVGTVIPIAAGLAATAIAYALGEGIGRLACVSFGCCYGKPVSSVPPRLRGVFARCNFVFAGGTKKIAYEGGLEGEPVIPIQGITAVLYVALALLSSLLFLHGQYRTALGVAFIGTQLWRMVSEVLRADYRGGGKISAYQIMALLGAVLTLVGAPALPADRLPHADIAAGLALLWHPGVIIWLQGLWLLTFLYTGRSVVTAATVSFHVHRDVV